MKVKFQTKFFGPNGARYRAGTTHDVPDDWADRLPKSAVVVEEPAGPPRKKGLESVPTTPAGKPVAAAT